MAWVQLRIKSTVANIELIGDLLEETGAVSVTFQDSHDEPVYEPLPGETLLWRETDVIALYDEQIELEPIITELRAHPLLKSGFSFNIESVEDEDWERSWMDNFHPLKFGQKLWICPSWQEIPDPQAINVMLDPGLAFGTGTHPTTALCLEWLDSLDWHDKTVIDFGCGSGILAIASLKLGAKRAAGIDIDSQAIQASQSNAEINGVADQLVLYLADALPSTLQAEVVVANILAGPLKELVEVISRLTKNNGRLCLSGILSTQASAVIEVYQPYFLLDPIVEKEDWCRITGRRR